MELTDSVNKIKGVGEKTCALFNKIHVNTIEDLLFLYPKRYLIYSEPVEIKSVLEGERAVICGTVNSYVDIRKVGNLKLVTVNIKDLSGNIRLVWFNMPYLKQVFHIGAQFIFVGTVVIKENQKIMEHPEYYSIEKYEEMTKLFQPVYSLTEGLSNKAVQKAVKAALNECKQLEEYLPQSICERYDLMSYAAAIKEVHYPLSYETLKKAKDRLIFDEFFIFQVAMARLGNKNIKTENNFLIKDFHEGEDFIKKLPYKLTNAQLKVIEEIKEDLSGCNPMNRLVQGDVGSGKTIIAVVALLMVVKRGYQGALMVPTEVLARQHYESFVELLEPYNIHVELLTGSVPIKEKRRIYQELLESKVDIVIGTHALIQEKVVYNKLALVITDEQHRFGVRQREGLIFKGEHPHVLVMSATPIPRTLGIILYGDLDISIIDELPANRLPIKNCVVGTKYRSTAYKFINKEIANKHQVYIICPMVCGSENIEVENVMDYAETVKKALDSSVNVRFLHGKMSAVQKDEIMTDFINGKINVLVSTTVIEVGINNPNATVMMIENAERFGLAQLHQLRGRVGRGSSQSYCIMVCGSESKEALERLNILNESNDGFYIANEDLKLRGVGDLFGTRQSGEILFDLADIYSNADMLKNAGDAIEYLRSKEFDLKEIKHPKLDKKLDNSLNL